MQGSCRCQAWQATTRHLAVKKILRPLSYLTPSPNKERSGLVYKNSEEKPEKEEVSQQSILNILAKEWEQTGPPGIMDISDIAGRLNISAEDVRRAIKPLFVMGAVDTDRVGFAAYLTPKGYALSRKEQSVSDH
jgi:DNA-binding MarR family transcriptional regulator